MRIAALLLVSACLAPAQERPGLFFREDFKETPPETPITQSHIANPDLILSLHGPGAAQIKKSHHDKPADDPYYVWSGQAVGNWAVSLRHKSAMVNLTGLAKIRWRSRQSGFREARIILKLADGSWVVSDQSDPASADWREREFNLGDIGWRRLDIKNVIEGDWVRNPDLSRVDEVGWTDLMAGGGSAACTRIDWIEVWGRPAPREAK